MICETHHAEISTREIVRPIWYASTLRQTLNNTSGLQSVKSCSIESRAEKSVVWLWRFDLFPLFTRPEGAALIHVHCKQLITRAVQCGQLQLVQNLDFNHSVSFLGVISGRTTTGIGQWRFNLRTNKYRYRSMAIQSYFIRSNRSGWVEVIEVGGGHASWVLCSGLALVGNFRYFTG